jgi:kinetochor protein Mis14/NSL1
MLSSSAYGTTSIEEHEPFNPKLWERAKELAQQEEDLIEEIAAMRRSMPGVALENARAAWKGESENDERLLKSVLEGVNVHEELEEFQGTEGLERQEEVEAAWRGAVKGLEGLKASLPEYVAKAERAGRAESYVLGKEKR